MDRMQFGFRIVGSCRGRRRVVDAAAALQGYADCDPRAEVDKEAYLSAFNFGDEFRRQLDLTGSTKGYTGVCGASWLWWDIDNAGDLDRPREDAVRLCVAIGEHLGIDQDDLLAFFSGAKGFHVGVPTTLWRPEPSSVFHRIARRFAERIAGSIDAVTDCGVYDRVRAFRAPNSRHPKTGLHKRWLPTADLMHLSAEAIVKMAAKPEMFDIPQPTGKSKQAMADWQAATHKVQGQREAAEQRCAANGSAGDLNRLTLQFIREGAAVGDRVRHLFSAAANLAEFGCSVQLAHALLTEAGLDCGLPPSEVRRQIECGLAAAKGGGVNG